MELKRDVFEVETFGDAQPPGYLLGHDAGEKAREGIYGKLRDLEPNTVLEVDFRRILYTTAGACNEVVVNVLRRLQSVKFPDKFFILSHLRPRVLSEIEYALNVAQAGVIVTKGEDWEVAGSLFDGLKAALAKVIEIGTVTARELQEVMGYKAVNQASSALSYLFQCRLVAREPVNGRKFRYFSLLSQAQDRIVEDG